MPGKFNSDNELLVSASSGTAGTASTEVFTIQGIASATPVIVGGSVASGAADSGNPVKAGGVYNSTLPTLTNGQRGDLQVDANGNLGVRLHGTQVTGADAISNAALTSPALPGEYGSSTRPLTTVTYNYNGSTWDRQRGDANGIVVQPGLSSTNWNYTSGASPILSNTTTAVTIKAAAGASIRNFIDAIQVTTTAFGTSVPIAIRDGAGGTVLWAGVVPLAGWLAPVVITFPMPLKGTANTLLEVLTTTANTTGTVTLNVQGHTGA